MQGEYSLAKTNPFTSTTDESTTTTKMKKSKNKRRFEDDQIKSLEVMFENESRLEPRKKLQIAEELGLQPRQVAIWFQNKRARWKSKQLEQEFSTLQGSYNSLSSCFESLEKEKQALQFQVQKLRDMLQEPKEENQHSGECVAMNNIDTESENGETERSESEVRPSASMERSKHVLRALSDDNLAVKAEYFGLEDSCLTSSTQDWGSFDDTGNFFDQSSSSYQWWDFWS